MRFLFLSLLLSILLVPEAVALTDEEIYEAFQFNFSLPGARSSSLGRTFVGLADDATASVSNPAGLTTLLFPEVSLEVKLTDHNIRRRIGLDTNSLEPNTKVFGDAVPQLSFLGLVYHWKAVTLGVYRYETFNFDEQFDLPSRKLSCCPQVSALPPINAQINMAISNWGGTAAVRLPKDFSLGLAMSGALMDMQTRTTRFSRVQPESILSQSIVNEADWSFSSTLGLLYRPSEIFSAGMFYSLNPRFAVNQKITGVQPSTFKIPLHVKVPDRFGIGLAVRPDDSLTFVADLLRVRYSEQTRPGYQTLLRFPDLDPNDFTIDDSWELHGGVEYVVLTRRDIPISMRAGLFSNPPHPLHYRGQTDTEQGKVANEIFSPFNRDMDIALTLGLGAVFDEYLQVDAAYLKSNLFNEATVSMIFHFGASP